jgi:hypothetical protein
MPDVRVADVRVAPQSAQNLADAALLCPQAWHASDSAAPHWLQNLLPSGSSALQVGHSITHPVEHTLKAPPRASTPLSLLFVFGGHSDAIGCVEMGQVCNGFRARSRRSRTQYVWRNRPLRFLPCLNLVELQARKLRSEVAGEALLAASRSMRHCMMHVRPRFAASHSPRRFHP